jgi:hypothetical protein
MYVGLQDNGTAKYTGEQVWRNVLFADGGYCVVNWADPFRVLCSPTATCSGPRTAVWTGPRGRRSRLRVRSGW